MKYLLAFMFMAIYIMGCNPARRIHMKNLSGNDVEIIWMIKEDSLQSSPFFMNNSKKVKFSLKPKAPYNSIRLSLGIGSWSNRELQNITDDLDSLIITTHNKEIKLGEGEIRDFLITKRKGMGKNKINLYIHE